LGIQTSYESGAFWSLLPTPDKQQPLEVEIEFIASEEGTKRWAAIFRLLETEKLDRSEYDPNKIDKP